MSDLLNQSKAMKETQQDAFYRELRLERVIKKYLQGMHRFKGFQYSSIGIALAKKMHSLQS